MIIHRHLINPDQDFEFRVFNILKELCSPEEPISTDYLLPSSAKKGDPSFLVDFYLPAGCKAIGWQGPTFIEVKPALTTTALEHLRRISEVADKPIKLISEEGISKSFLPRFKRYVVNGRDIAVYSLRELENKLTEIKGEVIAKKEIHEQASEDNEVITGSETPSVEISRPEDLAKNAFKNGNITLFLGAGVSVGAGLPQWESLLRELLKDSKQSPLEESDYAAIDVAAFNSNLITARYLLYPYTSEEKKLEGGDILRDALYREYNPTEKDLALINTIVELCEQTNEDKERYVSSIITFNYDDLVEKAMKEKGVPYVSITNDKKYELGKLPIIHVHGILSRDASNPIPILSEESYHQLYDTFNSTTNIEIVHALYRNTCIFIGLSMTDPNLRRLLESVRIKSGENSYHYAILPRVSLDRCNWDAASPTKYYQYSEAKDKDFCTRIEWVFNQLGVKIIWFDTGKYEQIPEKLREIAGINPSPQSAQD